MCVTGALRLFLLLTGLSCGLAADFLPFAGVDGLKPQRLEDFCRGTKTGERQLQKCEHEQRVALDDGGNVLLGWQMEVDPSQIISLDAEAEEGARLLSCGHGKLQLELPQHLARRLAPGHIILASRFVHQCQHLSDGHLYSRLQKLRLSTNGCREGFQRVEATVEELPSFAHAVPKLTFQFSYMPAEARERVKFPTMATDFMGNGSQQRRLMDGPFHFLEKHLKGLKGLEEQDGGFRQGGSSGGSLHEQGAFLNFSPKRVSNFGWNWDFFMNTTESPNYDIQLPGAKGIVKLRKPYIKMHTGIYLNFTSEFASLASAPKVNWVFGAHGHGYFQARVLASLNTTRSADVDPFATKTMELPLLESLKVPQWFQKVDLALGSLPVSFEPGFQFGAKLYHSGKFHGAMAVGGKTHGIFNPTLSYDSLKGFDAKMPVQLLDTTVIPPFWMIFTQRFELGLVLEPSILMRGDFAGLKDSTAAIDMKPYLNISISREQSQGGSTTAKPAQFFAADAGEEVRHFTVYPMRVMGLTGQKHYKVKVETNGVAVESKPQLNWGQVNFHDHVSHFDLGKISKRAAIAQSIIVTLLEEDDGAEGRELGAGQVEHCSDFPCAPSLVSIKEAGREVALVELAVLWDDEPEIWFGQQLRAASVAFPEVVLRPDALPKSALTNTYSPPLTIRFLHGGVAYTAPLVKEDSELTSFSSKVITQLGPSFLQSWLPCLQRSERCSQPRLELFFGSLQVAAADVQHVVATPDTAGSQDFPLILPLYSLANKSESLAVVKMSIKLTSPTSASLFLSPGAGAQIQASNAQQTFSWMLPNVKEQSPHDFIFTVLKMAPSADVNYSYAETYPSMHGFVLTPVGARLEVRRFCEKRAVGTLPADMAPCSFRAPVDLHQYLEPGDRAVALLQWVEDDGDHSLLSPPFEMSSEVLEARRLWSKDAWNARVQSHESCKERDLHFRLGAGMLMRGRITNLGLPRGEAPALGNFADQEPQLSTAFKRVASMKPGRDASDLLPEELCADGLCQGALPGCKEASFDKKYWPVLRFNFNRPFHFSEKTEHKFQGLMKEAMAYAFSTLPEDLTMVIHKLNSTRGALMAAPTTTLPMQHSWRPVQAGMIGAGTPQPVVPTTPTMHAVPARLRSGHLSDFRAWLGGRSRRLHERAAQEEEQEQHHEVHVSFKHGVHVPIKKTLIQLMLKHGYFMGVEDDASHEKGLVTVTSVDMDEEDDDQHAAKQAPEAARPQTHAGLAALAGGLGSLALLCMAVFLTHKPHQQKYAAAARGLE